VICMDMRMPEMDGLAATRAIRALGGQLATVPIIALTANAFPEDVAACFAAGMTGFVAKPVRKETLLAALLTAPGVTESVDAPVPAVAKTEAAPLDDIALARLADEIGTDGVAELIAMFAQETLARLEVIADPGSDRARRIREVHSLKGAAAAVCAISLSDRAAGLETQLKHSESIDPAGIDVAPLAEAFEAWRAAVRTAGFAETIAA